MDLDRPLPPKTVQDVFNRAIHRADARLWELIKEKPDDRLRYLAATDAFDLIRDEIQAQLSEVMNSGDT